MAQVMSYAQQQHTLLRRSQPSIHNLPRAYPPRRYEPYRSSFPRRPTYPPPSLGLNEPRLPPVPPPTPSPPPYQTGPKNYDPLRPEGLYQASKGARRDIKWMQKHASGGKGAQPPTPPVRTEARSQSLSNAQPQSQSRASFDCGPRPVERYRASGSGTFLPHSREELRRSYPGPQISPPRRISTSAERLTLPLPPRVGPPPPLQPHRRSYDRGLRFGDGGSRGDRERAIKEKMASMASAKARWVARKEAQRKSEWERKVKRIQLQVFVHARPTPCPWGSCPALLNSWALLEKHLHHAHLHPHSNEMPPPGRPVRCKIKECDQVFGTGGECLQHCLSSHMGIYGARCPFNCAYEGETFDALMSHIGRRHQTATPDDFVPGLIHHFPPNLPSASALPKLPTEGPTLTSATRSTKSSSPLADTPSPSVRAFKETSPRVISLVAKKCFSQKKPLPDHYIKKQGALAAISAIIDNVQREQLVTQPNPTSDLRTPNHKDEEEGEEELDPIDREEGLYNPASQPVNLLDLIDVNAEKRRAEKEARGEIKRLEGKGEIVPQRPTVHRFWTRSYTGSVDSEDNEPDHAKAKDGFEYQYEHRYRRRLLPPAHHHSIELSEDSDAETVSDSASASSVYEPRAYKTTSRLSRTKRQRTKLSR